MGKIQCACGHTLPDQSDLAADKAHFIADQDYMDFFEEAEKNNFERMTGKAAKYFGEIFQCVNCGRLIFFRQGAQKGVFFKPEDDEGKNILRSYLGTKWLGLMSANFRNGEGEIFWMTNVESGFRQQLSLEELKEFYLRKFDELSKLKILRHSFLRIGDNIEHEFDCKRTNK